jgi:hypothetical protein
MSMMAEAGKLKASGQRVQVSIMTFSAYRQARAWVLFQQLIMTLFLEGMSAQPALFLHWEPNWARSSITILNSTCLIFGSENPKFDLNRAISTRCLQQVKPLPFLSQ